jgi:hypothetical protein
MIAHKRPRGGIDLPRELDVEVAERNVQEAARKGEELQAWLPAERGIAMEEFAHAAERNGRAREEQPDQEAQRRTDGPRKTMKQTIWKSR